MNSDRDPRSKYFKSKVTALEVPSTFSAPLKVNTATASAAAALLARLERSKLIDRFRADFTSGHRRAALLVADALIDRGIPPAFWHSYLSRTDYDAIQRFDLFVYDVRWLRAVYPLHDRNVRYQRYRRMLGGSDATFFAEADYLFFGGARHYWQLVRSLSMSHDQQFDCWWLRSSPIAMRQRATNDMRSRIYSALRDDLKTTPRTVAFTQEHAEESLNRRHRIWLCSRMTDGSPSSTAARYAQLTGEIISRQVVAKQLGKIALAIRASDMT